MLRAMETAEDIFHVMRLGEKFHSQSPYADYIEYNPDYFRQTLEHMAADPNSVVFTDENSICAGLLSPMYFNKDYLIAHEIFWFADKNSKKEGTRVRAAFERWATTAGAKSVQMTCLADSHEKGMRRLLRIQGYEATEVSLLKKV